LKKIMIFLAVVFLLVLGALVYVYQSVFKLDHHVYDPAPVTERSTESGKVVGFIEDNGSHAWLGVPYAQAPVDELRWKAPRPVQTWEGVRDAVELSPVCTQYGGIMGDCSPLQFGKPTGEEDCLFLNLWAPAFSPDSIPSGREQLPVMVWIHGGGNTIGHGGTYNGKVLAQNHRVIVVTFNYRLGPFGWFTHPALSQRATTQEDRSGNYGTLDIIRVLVWVRDNIANFGGDPGNVTVFGESAGGLNTLSLLLSPNAAGLFHKAICQSGALVTSPKSKAENYADAPVPGHKQSSREIVNRLLVADKTVLNRKAAKAHQDNMTNREILEYLYGKVPAELLQAYEPVVAGMFALPELLRDGTVFPKDDPMTLLSDVSTYNEVPAILGTNRDENKVFMSLNPEYLKLGGVKDQAYYDLIAGYLDRGWKANGADEIAIVLRKSQGPSVYVYRFDWDEEPRLLGAGMGKGVGAGHGVEIAFVFNNFQSLIMTYSLFYPGEDDPGRKALAESMSSYWVQFAYTGSPARGREGREIEWSPWNNPSGEDKFIAFDTPEGGGIKMSSDEVRLANLRQEVLAETRFQTQKKHCEVYASIFGRHEDWNQEEYENLGTEGCRDYPKELFEW